jgi:hypothetical protein
MTTLRIILRIVVCTIALAGCVTFLIYTVIRRDPPLWSLVTFGGGVLWMIAVGPVP